jgi:hypothetical protein
MSAVSALAVGTDSVPAKGTTSPVAWSITQVSPTLVSFNDITTGIYSLYPTFSIGWRLPTAKSKLHRVTFKKVTPLDRPVVDAGSNTTHVVAGTIQATIDIVIPTLATSAERTEFYRQLIQILLDAQPKAAISDLNFPY